MKIAIMGAGLAGLSCAITLEKHGLRPDIYEKRSQVGDRFINGEIFLNALSHPQRDPLAHLADIYGIYLQPIGHIGQLTIYSEHETAVIAGHLGFNNLRGRDQDSTENQLARQVKSKIHFNSKKSYEELLAEYTHVVVATGDGAYAEKLHNYSREFTVSLYGSTLEGQFDRFSAAAWLDNRYAPKGYGYFIPLSSHEANLVVAYPDYPENASINAAALWEKLYTDAKKRFKQPLPIKDNFSIARYVIGLCHQARIGNTYFTGNCFGAIMPFLGFGQYPAILSGIYAAQAVAGETSYEDAVTHLRQSFTDALALRRGLEKLDNTKLDLLVRSLNTSLAQQLFNSSLNFLKLAGRMLSPFV